MSGSISLSSSCTHKWHVFHAPLCQRLPLWKKVANVMFHLLTLGIPFVLYRLIACCFKKESVFRVDTPPPPKPFDPLLNDELIEIRLGLRPRPNLSSLAAMVIQEIRSDLLDNRPDIKPYIFFDVAPENMFLSEMTARLCALRKECHNQLKLLFKEKTEEERLLYDPGIIKAMNQLIKVAFTEGMSMLDDLQVYRANLLSRKGSSSDGQWNVPSCAELLCLHTYPCYYITTALPVLYNVVRMGPVYNLEYDHLISSSKDLDSEYRAKFETPGTIHYAWRQLFNEYGQHILCFTDVANDFRALNLDFWVGLIFIND